MKEQLINFETAKLAKEKGFDVPTRDFYADESWEDEKVYNCGTVGYPEFTNDMESDHGFGNITPTSTQSLLQKWLREVHNIDVESRGVRYTGDSKTSYYQPYMNGSILAMVRYNSYEEALEIALQEALKLI